MRKLLRQNENIRRSSGLDIHRRIYVNHRNPVCAKIRQSKFQLYQNLLQDDDQSTAFEAVNSLLKVESTHLPNTDYKEKLCYQFLNFFEENAMKIRNEIDALETNMSDIETPTQIIVEPPMTGIRVKCRPLSSMLNLSHHAWIRDLYR